MTLPIPGVGDDFATVCCRIRSWMTSCCVSTKSVILFIRFCGLDPEFLSTRSIGVGVVSIEEDATTITASNAWVGFIRVMGQCRGP